MFKVGLTGGMGSGKSTAASCFSELGVTVIDLDKISREVVAKGTSALKTICTHFGPHVLTDKGELNRETLRQIIFENSQEREWLEALLHPLIRERQEQLLSETSSDYVVIEIPLLAENQLQETVDRVLVIDTDKQNQIERAADRDNSEASKIEAILESQASREDRLKIADDVIENSGSIEELKSKITEQHKHYSELAQAIS